MSDEIISNENLENNRNDLKLNKKKNSVGRPKGIPKTGGRKKDLIKEEDTSHWDEVLKQNLFNIPNEAIKLFFHKDTTNNLKFSILQFLAQYTTPSIKPKDKDEKEEEVKSMEVSQHDLLKAVNN